MTLEPDRYSLFLQFVFESFHFLGKIVSRTGSNQVTDATGHGGAKNLHFMLSCEERTEAGR
jgi:hypothetical protein